MLSTDHDNEGRKNLLSFTEANSSSLNLRQDMQGCYRILSPLRSSNVQSMLALGRIPRSRGMFWIVTLSIVTICFVVLSRGLDNYIQILGNIGAELDRKDGRSEMRWSAEEIALSNWTWGPFSPHHSLLNSVSRLSHVRCPIHPSSTICSFFKLITV